MKHTYPFNEYEFVFNKLLSDKTIRFKDYLKIREKYIEKNKYLYLYELSPRSFGEGWCEKHIKKHFKKFFEKPTKDQDPNYDGNYDFWYKGLRIEVKASRANNAQSSPYEHIVKKALSYEDKDFCKFLMNFQQIKPKEADYFIFIIVWRDKLEYLVFSSKDILENKYYVNKQHRGNKGEGQIHIKDKNIHEFDQYKTNLKDILKTISLKNQKRF